MHAALARAKALAGDRSTATGLLKKLEAMAKHRYVSPFEFAAIHFALGQTDLAFRNLAQACRDRAFDVLALQQDPRFDTFKGDDRFQSIIREIGLGGDEPTEAGLTRPGM
jgi:hypothetical protein